MDIFGYFRTLSAIPRASFNLDNVRRFLMDWASKNNFTYLRDTYGNVVVHNGVAGKPVIVQAHMDMVCVKNASSNHDFSVDPIQLVETLNSSNQRVLKGNGTTLGADNGIGLCAAMVLMENNKTSPIYLLATADEEEGLLGAKHLDPTILPHDAYVINVDSEEDGKVCAGNAGAAQCTISYASDIDPDDAYDNTYDHTYTFKLYNLRGGHSGLDINKGGRPSAIKLMGQVLQSLRPIDILSLNGGSADNAIAAHCECRFATTLPESVVEQLVSNELAQLWPTLPIKYTLTYNGPCKSASYPNALDLINIIPQGIIHMHDSSTEFVDTSTNLGVVTTDSDGMKFVVLTRSSVTYRIKKHYDLLEDIANQFGCSISEYHGYCGWAPNWDTSKVLNALKKTYRSLFDKECIVHSVHAGLEVSAMLEHYPMWECMSIGPQINYAHSDNEELIIDTVEPFYKWLETTMKELVMT